MISNLIYNHSILSLLLLFIWQIIGTITGSFLLKHATPFKTNILLMMIMFFGGVTGLGTAIAATDETASGLVHTTKYKIACLIGTITTAIFASTIIFHWVVFALTFIFPIISVITIIYLILVGIMIFSLISIFI